MKEVKLRRYQNLLTVSGLGVIVFGLWSVIKTLLVLFMQEDTLDDIPDSTVIRVIFFAILGVVLLVDLLLRLFVGLSARAEGFGKKKSVVYIIFAFLLAIVSLVSVVMIFFDMDETSIDELIVSVIVEGTSLIVVIELLVAAFNVKKLKKELGEVQ